MGVKSQMQERGIFNTYPYKPSVREELSHGKAGDGGEQYAIHISIQDGI